jgi:hypothetical protein
MPDSLGVLACDKPQHAEQHIFGGIATRRPTAYDVESLAFKAKINILPVDKRNKRDVKSAQALVVCRFQLNELYVDLKRQVSSGAVLFQDSTQSLGDVVFFLVSSWCWHFLPTRDDESKNHWNHRVD